MKKRVFGLDLVRSVAFFFVILVHSFSRSGFNTSPLSGFQMFSLLMIRCLAFVGVLLFIIITGYCKSHKNLSKEHFYSITRILIIYFIISIVTIFFEKFYFHSDKTLYDYIIGILNFTTIPYAWYIEMYIGLFLLIPFLNILYNNLQSKQNKIILLLTLLFISSISGSFTNLNIEGKSLDVLPYWWGNLYPILLYYVGVFIREYGIKINKVVNFIFITVIIFIQSFMMFFYSQGQALLDSRIFLVENNFPSILLSIFVFLFLYNIKIHSKFLSKTMYYISYASFGGFLISYCYDLLFYDINIFNKYDSHYFLMCTFLLTPLIFFTSTITSIIINKIYDFMNSLFKKLKSKHDLLVKNKDFY